MSLKKNILPVLDPTNQLGELNNQNTIFHIFKFEVNVFTCSLPESTLQYLLV